jgi:hypothetical protein
MVDGIVLHVTNSLRGQISPIYLGYFWRCCCQLFTYHRGPLVEWFATHNSMWLSYNTDIILCNIIRKKYECGNTHVASGGVASQQLSPRFAPVTAVFKPSQAKVLTGGGDLHDAQVDVHLSVSHSCVWLHRWAL